MTESCSVFPRPSCRTHPPLLPPRRHDAPPTRTERKLLSDSLHTRTDRCHEHTRHQATGTTLTGLIITLNKSKLLFFFCPKNPLYKTQIKKKPIKVQESRQSCMEKADFTVATVHAQYCIFLV